MAKLAALVPKPRANLTRYHGVLVAMPHHPNSKRRIFVTPAKRGKGNSKYLKALKERNSLLLAA
jgi:hypothetical protein